MIIDFFRLRVHVWRLEIISVFLTRLGTRGSLSVNNDTTEMSSPKKKKNDKSGSRQSSLSTRNTLELSTSKMLFYTFIRFR